MSAGLPTRSSIEQLIGKQQAAMQAGKDEISQGLAGLATAPKPGEVFEELHWQQELLSQLGSALNRLETSISAVMRPVPNPVEQKKEQDTAPKRGTNVGRTIADHNQQILVLIQEINSVVDSVSI